MIKNTVLTVFIILLIAGCNKNTEYKNNGPNTKILETRKTKTAYMFLLKKLSDDNIYLIASQDNKNTELIYSIIQTNNLNLEVEDYNNLEKGPDLCFRSVSTKKIVTIIDTEKRSEESYYVSYYIGPEGGASKEIRIEKLNDQWIVTNDDGKWSIK